MKKFIPNYYINSIFDLDVSFLLKHQKKCVFCDLDNTLDQYDVLNPSQRVIDLKNNLESNGIELIIISNNKAKNKQIYAQRLGVKSLFSTRKPFKKRINNFIESLPYEKREIILVGDQLLTDVLCGKNANIEVMLTEPISKKDQWTTRFNRLLDRPIRNHLRKKGYLESVEVSNG